MYEVTYRPIATQEYEEAIKWYAERSKKAAENFITAIDVKLDSISENPKRYKNLFKNYYETSTNKYPYTIVYFVEEQLMRIVIVAIYHSRRNPKMKYRK